MTTTMQRLSATEKRSALAVMRKCPGLCLLLLLFFLVVGFVNPVREMMIDDEWAYSLTVQHLLATGEYRLHDWAAANMPIQIYWGALLAQLFGYSFTVLHLSTLTLLLVGLIVLYHLLRDFGMNDTEASLLTLVVLSSPPVLFLSFTFQTDVQFLGWLILALWLYTRALRRESYPLMALASVAAFAAIGTRQFGAALVVGLFATWLLLEQQRLRKAPLYIVGLVLPLMMTIWRINFGVSRPTFSQKVRLAEQLAYVRDLPDFVVEGMWRPTVILQYLGLFLLPLAPLLVVLVRNAWGTRGRDGGLEFIGGHHLSRSGLWLLAAWTVYITAGVCYGYFFYLPGLLMPSLAWLLPNSEFFPFGFKKCLGLVLTLLTYGFAVVLGWLLSRKYLEKGNWGVLPRAEWFFVLSGLALLGLQLLYVQFYDVYLIQFLPFAVFALGRMLHAWPGWCKVLTAVLCLVMLSVSSLWSRGNLTKAEANWQAAEIARSAGAVPQQIGGNMTWSCYHGAFDEWIAEVGGSDATDRYSGSNQMHSAFFNFLYRRYDRAKYVFTSSLPDISDKSWQVLGRVEYRDRSLRQRDTYILMRAKAE